MTWTDERTDRLTQLFEDDWSASMIARDIGVTRNAVIGKLHRLGLVRPKRPLSTNPDAVYRRMHRNKPGHKPKLPPVYPRVRKSPTERIRVVRAGRMPKVEYNAPVAFLEALRPCSFWELTPTTCRWPYGDPGMPEFHFCGGFVWDKTYCKHHHALAHSPEKPRTPWVPMRRAA
jgi:GcrA cell cycle regulator